MAINLELATNALRNALPRRAMWKLHGTNLSFDFSRAQVPLQTIADNEFVGEPDAQWEALLVFGEQDYANGGGACVLLTIDCRDGTVHGLDLEREQPVFLLNSTVSAFVATFIVLDEYFKNDVACSPDLMMQLKEADASAYQRSEWRLFAEQLVST